MNKRYERNHFKAFSDSVNHKKMYKKGKNWIVGSLTLLALAGLGVTADHSVHADADVNTKAATTSVGSTADIEHKAKAMYNGMIAHSMTTPAQGKAKLANNGKPSVTSGFSTSSSSAASGSAAKATQSISQPTNNKGANQAKPAVHFGGFGAMREVGDAKPAPDVSPDPYNADDDVAAIAKENGIMNSEAPKAEAGNIPYFREDFQDKFGNDSQGFVAASEALSNDYANYKSMLGSNPSTATTAYVASDYNSAKSYFDDAQTQYSDIFPAPNFNPNEFDTLVFVYRKKDSNGNIHSDVVGTHTFNQKSPGNKLGSDTDNALMKYLEANGQDRKRAHWQYMPIGYQAIPSDESTTDDGTWNELNELISRWTQMNGYEPQAKGNGDAFANGNEIQFILHVEPYPQQRSHFKIQYYLLGTDPNNEVGSDLLGGKPGGICGSIDSDMMFPNGSYVKSLRDNSTSPKGVPEGYTLAPGVASELIDAYADNPRVAYQLEHFPSGEGETAVLPLPVVRATTNTVYWVYTNPKTHQKTYTVAINDAETDSDVQNHSYTDSNFVESPVGFAVTDGPNFTSKDYQLMNLPSGFIPSDVNSVAPSIMNFVQYFNPSGASKKLYINIEKQATDTVNYVYNGQIVSVNNKPATHIFSGTSDKKDNDLTNYYNNKIQGKWSDVPKGYQVTNSDKASFYQQMANYYKATNGLYDDYVINIPLTKPKADIHVYYENADTGANLLTESSYSNFTAGARDGFNLSDAVPNYKSKFNGYHFVNALHPTTKYDSDNNEIHTIDLLYAPNTSTKDYAPAIDTVNYLISGTSTPVSAPANNVTEYSRADVSSASSARYGSWATNRAFSSISYPSMISANGKYYSEVATGTNLTPPTNAQVSDSLDNSSTNHLASFANNVYYVPASSASGSQSAAVNETVDYILYSKGGSTVESSASEVVNYTRPDSYNQYTGQVTASGNWSATNSFNVPASPSYKGWHVIASNLSMPDTANLQPNDRLSFNYQVDYVSDTYGVTSSAVNSTANERINYYQGDSLASSYSSAVNVSQTRYSYSGQNFSGGWSTRTPFSSQADPSYPGWTIDSRSGSIPVGVSTLNPGTYTENVYYDPAKANVHIYYENAVTTSEIANYPEVSLSADARAPFNLSDYLNHNYEKSIAGFSYVGALHATSSFDPTNGETHNIDLLYAPTSSQSTNEAPATDTVNYYVQGEAQPFSSAVSVNRYARADVATGGVQSYGPWLTGTDFSAINVPAEISSAGNYYHLVSANSTLPTPDQVNSALGNAASVGNASFTNDIVYAPDNVINSSENASATETTYYYWNNGSSNVSSASATNIYDYARSASYDVNTQRFLSAGGWSQTNHTVTQAQGSAASGYHLIGSFGTLPNSAALANDLVANQDASYANYVVYAPDSICDTHDFTSATDKVNYLVSGTSSAVSPTSTSVLVYSRADVNDRTTGKSFVSDWRTNQSFSEINVPQYLVSNGTTYSEVSADQTLPNVTQNSLTANNANYRNNVYYVPITNGTVAVHYVDSDGQELPNVPVQYSSKPTGSPFNQPKYPAQVYNFTATKVTGYNAGMTYPNSDRMDDVYVHYNYDPNGPALHYVNTDNGKVVGHVYPALSPKATKWTLPSTAFQQLPSGIAQSYEFNNSYDNDANQKLMMRPTVTINGKTIVNVYVQPKPTQSDGIVTINYVGSDFHPIAPARQISGPVDSTVNLNDPQYQQAINGYNPVGLSSDQVTYRDYNQNVYVIYRPKVMVSRDGHIHVRYVDDTNHQQMFFSDKFSDEAGSHFNLAWDNYEHRNIPGYHFDGNVHGQVSTYGRDSKFDPHVIVVGYAKNPSDSIINVHQTSYANDLINYVEDDDGHLTVLKSASESIPFSGNATVNKNTGQFSSATSWSAEQQFSSAASLTFPGLSEYKTVGNIPASAAVGGNYAENIYYRPMSSASSQAIVPPASSSASSQSSATPQPRSTKSTNLQTKPTYIPKKGNGRVIRRRMIRHIKRIKSLIHRDIHKLQRRTETIARQTGRTTSDVKTRTRELRKVTATRSDLIKNEIRLVKLEKAHKLPQSKLPQTDEPQSYSALYAMLFVISAVILASLGRAIDRRHE